MKKIIFICLLSLSTCLSRPDGQPAPQSPVADVTDQKPQITKQDPGQPTSPAVQAVPTKSEEKPAETPVKPQDASQNPPPVPKTDDTKGTSPKTDTNENKTTEKKETDKGAGKETTTVAPPKPDAPPKPADKDAKNTTVAPVTNATVPSTTQNGTVTDKTDVPTKPTEAPKAAGTTVQARGFDGASFVGGIILTLGLLAIGFMGLKYYKNQTERNYHTL